MANKVAERLSKIAIDDAERAIIRAKAVASLDPALVDLVMRTFQSEDGAAEWLVSEGIASLGYKAPVDLATTPEGVQRIKTVLNAINHGIVL